MGDLLPYQPSLASATNTRLDTACKHHQQCRVSYEDMLVLTRSSNDNEELKRNKYRYCIHKDEFVIGVGRPWAPDRARKRMNNAYPRVISNIGQMGDTTDEARVYQMMWAYMFHNATTLQRRNQLINIYRDPNGVHGGPVLLGLPVGGHPHAFNAGDGPLIQGFLPLFFDPVSVGYANTLGYAHADTGDTMVTVHIGGLRTVMNGDFEIFTGDLIQWYFPFELNSFHADGSRKRIHDPMGALNAVEDNIHPAHDMIDGNAVVPIPRSDAAIREKYHSRSFGNIPGNPKVVAKIKPFVRDDEHPRMYDYLRVFGVALSCARPHEMVDIKIARQSM